MRFLGELVDFNIMSYSDEEMILKIKNRTCRYKNIETYNVIKDFIKNRRLNFNFKKINKKLKTNICLKNDTREKINSLFSNGISIGDKAILLNHYEKQGFFKGYEFIIENIEDGIINGIFKEEDIDLGYCITSHKKQGKTINQEYNIYDTEIMSFENLFTAITRTDDINKIRLGNLKKYYYSEYNRFSKIKNCFNNCEIGKVYIIECDITGNKYIGYTLRDEKDRLKEHTEDKNCIVYKTMKNPKISVIGNVYGCKKIIEEYEHEYITEYKKIYGDKLINLTNFKEKLNEVKGCNTIGMNIELIPSIHEWKDKFVLKIRNIENGKIINKKWKFLRNPREKVFDNIMEYVKDNYNGKYRLHLMDDMGINCDGVFDYPVNLNDFIE